MARQRINAPRIPDGPRAQRSIDALRQALLLLIESKPIGEITIRNITDTAGLSYPTFFRRFARKEELLEDLAASEVRKALMLAVTAVENGGLNSGAALCEYIHEHRILWRTLLTGGAASVMRDEFMRVSRESWGARPRINLWIPDDLALNFVSGGIFEILTWWMRQPDDYPVSRVIKLFDALIVDTAYLPRNITLD